MWYGRSSPVRFGTIINTPAVTVVAYNCKVLFVLFYIVAVLLWSSIMKNKMGNKACNIKKVDKTKLEEAGIEPATCRMQSDHSTPELHPLCLKLPNLYLTYNQLAFFTPTKNKFGELK